MDDSRGCVVGIRRSDRALPSRYSPDAGRIEEGDSAAVPEGETVDLYGEYWDARGSLRRVETHYAAIESALSSVAGGN